MGGGVQGMAMESRPCAAQSRRHRHDGGLADCRLQTILYRARGGRLELDGLLCGTKPPMVRTGDDLAVVFGLITAVGRGLLFWDLLTIGKGETRKTEAIAVQ